MSQPSQEANRVQNNFFVLIGLGIFILFFTVTVWGNDGILDLIELKQKRDTIKAKNYALLKENMLFRQEIHHLKTMSYIEQRARSDLGLVRPDEWVFVIE